MIWRVFKAFRLPWQELDDKVSSFAEVSREDPKDLLPGSDLSVEERRKELEREAQRRSERPAR
jgi:hypothetical protein